MNSNNKYLLASVLVIHTAFNTCECEAGDSLSTTSKLRKGIRFPSDGGVSNVLELTAIPNATG